MPNSSTSKATEVIPATYRFLLTNVESLCALIGVYMVLTTPGFYVSGSTRSAVSTVDPSTQFIYTQLGGGWLFISFIEAVVLRFCDDVKVWRLLCLGILLSDALFTYSMAQAVGGFGEYLTLSKWTGEDVAAAVGTWPFVIIRVLIVLGIGFKKGGAKRN